MFHLEHDAFVGLISSRNRFRNNPIQASSLKAAEPVLRDLSVSSRRSQMDRRCHRRNQLFQLATAFLERLIAKIAISHTQQIKKYKRSRSLLRQKLHP